MRAHPDQVERWTEQAEREGVPLTTWMRGVCDGLYEPAPPADGASEEED